MEVVETWAVDDVESVVRELISFGRRLADVEEDTLANCSDEMMQLMAYIFSSKSIRLLNWLDENFPGLTFSYISEARNRDDWDPGLLLLDRLKTIKTISLLGVVFSPMRTRIISSLLDELTEDD